MNRQFRQLSTVSFLVLTAAAAAACDVTEEDTLIGLGPAPDTNVRNYSVDCDRRMEELRVERDGDTMRFAWDGPGAQAFEVYDRTADAEVWRMDYSPTSGWESGNFDDFNQIGPSVTYGEVPAGLDADGFEADPAAGELISGHDYLVSAHVGCSVDIEGDWYNAINVYQAEFTY